MNKLELQRRATQRYKAKYARPCEGCGVLIARNLRKGATGRCKKCFYSAKSFLLNMSKAKIGKLNPMWKGDAVGYNALHEWVHNRVTKPTKCQNCNKSSGYLDLANKGVYNRDLNNWWFLCRRCHMQLDGRMNNLRQRKEK